MKCNAQRFILHKVLERLKDAEFSGYHTDMLRGSLNADWPNVSVGRYHFGFTAATHFYHPDRKTLLPNAKDLGIKNFEKAKRLYPHNKKRAYYCLGKAFHLLTGIAIPAHSQFSHHPFDSDDLERFLEGFVLKNPSVHIRRVNESLSMMFDSLARKSCKYRVPSSGLLCSFKYGLFGNKDGLSEKELHKQANDVLDLAVSYGYSLCCLFKEQCLKKV